MTPYLPSKTDGAAVLSRIPDFNFLKEISLVREMDSNYAIALKTQFTLRMHHQHSNTI